MNNDIEYRETLPRFVFSGDFHTRRACQTWQWISRAWGISILIAPFLWMILLPVAEDTFLIEWFCFIIIWIGGICILLTSEGKQQAAIDGSVPTVIHEGQISLPPRRFRKLLGKQDFIAKDQIGSIEVRRGRGTQYFTKKDCIIWHDAPIGLVIVTRSGKRYGLGAKPPKTVMEIADLLATRWEVQVRDSGRGMGTGLKHVNKRNSGPFSYEDIVSMGLFDR